MSEDSDYEDDILTYEEEIQEQFRSACRQKDLPRIRQLFSTTPLGAADATGALRDALHHIELTRCLLEAGADPKSCIRPYHLRSFPMIKLLVEFGYDIASTGHLVLQ